MTLCECETMGTFSITNDLYDPDVSGWDQLGEAISRIRVIMVSFYHFLQWRPVIIENIPLIFATYIGCIIVSLFGITTFASLTYLK